MTTWSDYDVPMTDLYDVVDVDGNEIYIIGESTNDKEYIIGEATPVIFTNRSN